VGFWRPREVRHWPIPPIAQRRHGSRLEKFRSNLLAVRLPSRLSERLKSSSLFILLQKACLSIYLQPRDVYLVFMAKLTLPAAIAGIEAEPRQRPHPWAAAHAL